MHVACCARMYVSARTSPHGRTQSQLVWRCQPLQEEESLVNSASAFQDRAKGMQLVWCRVLGEKDCTFYGDRINLQITVP